MKRLVCFLSFSIVACGPGLEAPCEDEACSFLEEFDAGEPAADGGTDAGLSPADAGTSVPSPPDAGACAPYTETLPSRSAPLAAYSYNGQNLREYVLAVLKERYPLGHSLASRAPTSRFNCIELFAQKSSQTAVLRSLSTVVHECGHVLDLSLSSGRTSAYVIRDDLQLDCRSGDTTTRGGKTFARSLITRDAYSARRPPCNGASRAGCDSYADIYLDGDPANTQFESGDQGFAMLPEEAVQYVNSLATGYAFVDQLGSSRISEKDGILTFQWYLERYLRMARIDYPQAYDFLATDSCWREAIATVWNRAEFYLAATKNEARLGIDAAALETLVRDPQLLAEMGPFLQCRP